jgi:hypothetical protein
MIVIIITILRKLVGHLWGAGHPFEQIAGFTVAGRTTTAELGSQANHAENPRMTSRHKRMTGAPIASLKAGGNGQGERSDHRPWIYVTSSADGTSSQITNLKSARRRLLSFSEVVEIARLFGIRIHGTIRS